VGKVFGAYHDWIGINGADSKGFDFGGEFALTPNLTLAGGTHGNLPGTRTRENYAMLRFRLGGQGASLLTEPVSSQAYAQRDLSRNTLDKVRRENRIMVERTIRRGGVTVVITRTG
jgi:hypothetical protein